MVLCPRSAAVAAPTTAVGTLSPTCIFLAPQTICAGSSRPTSVRQTTSKRLRRSAVRVLLLENPEVTPRPLQPRLREIECARVVDLVLDQVALGVTDRTVRRDWVKARTLLYRWLTQDTERSA